MKNFAAFLLLLTLAAFTVGCEKKKEATPPADTGAPPAEAPAEKPAEGG
jgi:hypothetical protein